MFNFSTFHFSFLNSNFCFLFISSPFSFNILSLIFIFFLFSDIKPANILVSCSDCSVKIADFGLSRVVEANGHRAGMASFPSKTPSPPSQSDSRKIRRKNHNFMLISAYIRAFHYFISGYFSFYFYFHYLKMNTTIFDQSMISFIRQPFPLLLSSLLSILLSLLL